MPSVAMLDAARLTSLMSGRGETPSIDEWFLLAPLLVLVGVLGSRLLLAMGLSRVEAILVAAVSPLLVFADAPLGSVSPRVGLAANVAGCLVPLLVSLKIAFDGRMPLLEGAFLVVVGIVVAFASADVVHGRGVLLQYRIPALVVGLLAAGLLFRVPARAGAGAFVAGTIGVIVGADLLHLAELASGATGRIVLGGAGLMDGIVLVAVLAAAVAEGAAVTLRALVGYTTRRSAPA